MTQNHEAETSLAFQVPATPHPAPESEQMWATLSPSPLWTTLGSVKGPPCQSLSLRNCRHIVATGRSPSSQGPKPRASPSLTPLSSFTGAPFLAPHTLGLGRPEHLRAVAPSKYSLEGQGEPLHCVPQNSCLGEISV